MRGKRASAMRRARAERSSTSAARTSARNARWVWRSRTAISASRAAWSRTVGRRSSRAAAPMAAWAAVSLRWSWGPPGKQLVVGGQGGSRAVVAGERADRDDGRDLAAGLPSGVDDDSLGVENAGARGLAHRGLQRRRGQSTVREQHFDERPLARGVAAAAAGGI